MTPPMIAAQEQRLRRIAELSRIPRLSWALNEWVALTYLARMVRQDATLHGGAWRINRA